MTKNRTRTPVYLDPGMHPGLEVKGLSKKIAFYLGILGKPVHFIFYLSTLQKPAAGADFRNELKYKADTFYLSTIQKPAPHQPNLSSQLSMLLKYINP